MFLASENHVNYFRIFENGQIDDKFDYKAIQICQENVF